MNKRCFKPQPKPTPVQCLCWLATASMGMAFQSGETRAQTSIVADPNAARSQQASVIRSSNNTIQVNIQTPSAAGVSRNTYKQFDIGRDGAILNNSSTNVQTQIGGWVQANPWLATGGARVILNEVNSPNPSQLKGFIEVAGQRAEVVIANPSGISVNGGGFINASRVHLTTGTPVINAGNIDSFRVQSGTVSIDGQGLDNRTVDYTAILSRALQVNAGIWANALKVVTGSNQITANSLAPDTAPVATAISGNGTQPAFAVDVSQLGGMYAGKIHLIGTEAGLGVRNAGSVQANSGPLVISLDGWLTNSGSMQSSQNMQITANGNMDNSGSILARGQLNIKSNGKQTHSGTTMTSDALILKGDSIDLSQGKVSAKQASITALSGDVNATASQINVNQNLDIQTPQSLITDSASVSTDTLDLQANAWRNVDGSFAHTGTRDLNIHLEGDFDNTRGVLKTNSNKLTMQANTLMNSGLVFAGADMSISTRILDNQGSLLARNNLDIVANTLTATSGSLMAAGMTNEGKLQANPTGTAKLNIAGTGSLQSAGQVLAYGDVQISGSSLDLQHSQTASQTGSLSLTASEGDINTSNAVFNSPGNISISANQHTGQGLINQSGHIRGNSLTLELNKLDNTSGTIAQTGNTPLNIELGGGSFTNKLGTFTTAGGLSLKTGPLNNEQGTLVSSGEMSLQSGLVNNKQGTIGSQTGSVNISSSTGGIDNTEGLVQAATDLTLNAQGNSNSINNTDGQLIAKRNLSSNSGAFDNTRGLVSASSALSLQTSTLNNQGTVSSVDGMQITADTFSNGGVVYAGKDLNIDTNTLNNQGSLVARNNQSVATDTLTTANGSLMAAGMTNEGKLQANPNGTADLRITASQSLQSAGQMLAYGDMQLSGSSLDLQHSQTASQTGSLSLTASEGDINTSNAVISSPGNISISAHQHNGQGLINQSGHIRGNSLNLKLKKWDNTSGTIAQTGNTPLDIDLGGGSFTNKLGTFTTVGGLSLKADPLNNEQGTLVSNGDLSVQSGILNNHQGTIGSQTGSVNISSIGGIDNTQGLISAHQQLTLQTNGAALSNTNTIDAQQRYGLQAGASVNIQSGALDNSSGYINANGLTVTAASVNNRSGLVISNADSSLSSATFDNRSGQWLSVDNIVLKLDSLDNSSQGSIQSAGALNLQADGSFNNATGVLSATTGLSIGAWKATTPTLSIDNSGGVIKSDGSLGIKVAKLNGAGTVESGTQSIASRASDRQANAMTDTSNMDMAIELQGDYTTQGTMRSAGNLSLKTTGKLTNNKSVSAGHDLTVAAANIDNQVDGEFISGNTTSVNAANDFTNRGLVDGAHTQINSNTLTNLGTGRIYGDRISIAANTLTNKQETLGNSTTAATIASRNDLDIGAQTLINQEHALIYSDGDMSIAGALDANRRATGRANSVTNSSSTIEAGSNLAMTSSKIDNANNHFAYEERKTSQESNVREVINSSYYRIITRTIYDPFVTSTDPGKILSGANMNLNAGTITNRISQIIAGESLNIPSGNIQNIGEESLHRIVDIGSSYSYQVVGQHCGWDNWRYGCDDIYGWAQSNYTPASVNTTVKFSQANSMEQTALSGVNIRISDRTDSAKLENIANSDITKSSIVKVINSNIANMESATGVDNPTISTSNLGGLSTGQNAKGTSNTLPVVTGNSPNPVTTPQKVNVSPVLEIRSAALPQSVSNSSLYKTRPDPTSKYLVETDPRFTNQKTWLSSDYMLKNVALDPAMSQKRMGDGFYEQKLIREQVAQLTGRRFLGDYTNDEQQYQALMNNALTTAQALNLRPGIALTAAQMALLTSDMVWLVEQTVTLADGSKQKVLIPQLYVRVKPGDLDGSGALMAGDTVNMNLTGDLNNSGTIAGRKVLNITAQNIQNLGGTLSADNLNAVARLDINNTGGTIEALSAASLVAGRDVNMTTTTQSSKSTAGLSNFSQTGVDRVAALYVKNPGGTLTINAGQNVNLTAAKIDSQGSASLQAGNNINLNTVTTEQTNNLVVDANNYNRSSSSKDLGSSITAANNLTLNAGNDINAKAATVQAGGALDVNAGNDINIVAGENKQSSSSASKSTSSGFFTSSSTTTQSSSASIKAIASTFSGNTTSIVADNNLTSVGTSFKGNDNLFVEGKNDQKFYEAVDQSNSTSKTESSSSLLGFTVDKSSNSSSQAQTTALGSKLISDKAITINVGNSAEFKGAEISAPKTNFNNIDPNKPGTVTLGGATETTQTTRSSSSETASVWQSQSGGGTTVQNLKQTTISGNVKFDDKLKVIVQLPNVVNTSGNKPNANANANAGSVSNVNQASVQSQIETLSQQPGLGYLKQLSARKDINWQQVLLAHDNWNYSQEGLTPAGAALLSIAVAAYAPGLSSGIMTAAGSGAVATGLNAGFVALQAQAAVAMVNNGGDINKTLQELGSNQNIKSLLTSMITAGALQAMNTAMTDTSSATNATNTGTHNSVVANVQSGAAVSGVNGVTTAQTANAFTQNLTRNLTNNMAAAVIDSAINNKPLNIDTVSNALKSSLITSGMASGANAIGDATKNVDIDTFTQKVAHAVLGCVGGATSTGHSSACSPGAVGAVVGEMAADYYMNTNEDPKLSLEQNKTNALAFAKVVSAASGIVAGGGGEDVAAVNVAGMTGANAAENNYLLHNKLKDEEGELRRLKKQKASAQCDAACITRIQELETLDKLRDEQLAPLIAACEKAGRNNCKGEAIAKNFAQANGFGAESMKRESNAGTLGSPFSFNNCPSSDKGGCSYGPLQIAADTGMMNAFIDGLKKNPSEEAQSFYKQLQAAGGVSASQNKDPAFIQTWMQLTSKDPQFVQYQIDALVNENLYPVVQELQKVGVDFNNLTSSQKEALFSAAVQHGAGTKSKTKGADNVLERAISVAQTDAEAPSFPTYTRQELVYGQVEDQMRAAEETQNKLGKQRESLITQRESLISQRESLISQQLKLERQKSQLLEKGMGASSEDLQQIQTQVKALDKKISSINEQVTPITTKVDGITTKVDVITNQISVQNKYIKEAAQYLKSQAQGSLADGEQWLKDFYEQRTQMYPSEAARYKKELDSLLKQYREEQKAKQKKR